MSNVQWFYADAQQQQQGPVAFEQIQQLAASGQIQAGTLIWNESMPSWTAASQVQGVFNAGAPPVATAAPMLAPQANPYAAPNTGYPMAAAPTGGSYPIPPVRKCSFALFLMIFLLGLIVYVGGAVKFFSDVNETTSAYESEFERFEQIETREDANKFSQDSGTNIELEPPSLAGFGIMALGFFILIAASIVNLVHLQRAWTLLQPGGARTTPGKGAWFNLIPLFNLYWMFVGFHGWAQDWNRIRNNHPNLAQMPSVSEGLFLAGPICVIASIVPLVGILAGLAAPVIYIIMAAKICKVVNSMAAASQPR